MGLLEKIKKAFGGGEKEEEVEAPKGEAPAEEPIAPPVTPPTEEEEVTPGDTGEISEE